MNLQGVLIAAVVAIAVLLGPPAAPSAPARPSPSGGCR
jgi:hypothetical protein